MALREIVLPATEPETEWVRGRALQKVSPTWWHAKLQAAFARALGDYAGERAQVGTEWRFRVAPPGEAIRPLVPDVALVWNERLRGLPLAEVQTPLGAPDIAVEILSPDDRSADVEDKIATYLRSAAQLVVVVDPAQRSVTLVDPEGRRSLAERETLEHQALPGFALSLRALFAALELPR
jgi:Uma2 family endonuclease